MTSKQTALKEDEADLRDEIAQLEEDLAGRDADALIKDHIRILHEYNELKDATQMMIGKIASIKNTTIREVHDDYGLSSED